MRPSEPSLVQLWLSGGLDLSEQLQKEAPQRPAESHSCTREGSEGQIGRAHV